MLGRRTGCRFRTCATLSNGDAIILVALSYRYEIFHIMGSHPEKFSNCRAMSFSVRPGKSSMAIFCYTCWLKPSIDSTFSPCIWAWYDSWAFHTFRWRSAEVTHIMNDVQNNISLSQGSVNSSSICSIVIWWARSKRLLSCPIGGLTITDTILSTWELVRHLFHSQLQNDNR